MKPVNIIEITSVGCHNCEAFAKYWGTVKGEFPNVVFQKIDITDPIAQELIQKHMIMASPGVIINGELFSTGGVNTNKFRETIEQLSKEVGV